MKHKDEICRWVNCPDGTKVWRRHYGSWELFANPIWDKDKIYIVNDEWAELRKAIVDGKQMQYKGISSVWFDVDMKLEDVKDYHINKLRIKPEELIYEWQWILKRPDGNFWMSKGWYTDDEAKKQLIKLSIVERYEPSKRIRK